MSEIEELSKKLVSVKDPTTINVGSEEIDEELHKLAKNKTILAKLKYLIGLETNNLKAQLSKRKCELAISLNIDELEKVSVVKSNKFKYIDLTLYTEIKEYDDMHSKYRYTADLYDDYQERINIYKKSRTLT